MVEFFEYLLILVLNMLVASIVFLQEYCIGSIRLSHYRRIFATVMAIRSLVSIWIIYPMTATLLGTLNILVIQSIILLFLWGLMQCVKKYGGKWYITMIALIIYGLSCYFHIMYAKTV
ncbi:MULTISPECIES: hypothetical protein [Bacillus cereus group]|nr:MULTISPECIES: hypothetical protein [Bacillus cereus group]KMP46817.1 hypothetical protein TU56_22780 [Bacillus cereus]MBF8115461.1 hypothetical protein [Bacillus cereus]MCA1000837.1 hypothetical protein [Bacillus thuringiensis]MCC2367433.1 hypothetical protein [Bacillus cereus]MCC2451549.1 hypothetical protein [Bacillus cereus]